MVAAKAKKPSPWLKRVLIPFWILQLLCLIALFGLIVYTMVNGRLYA